ncbi:hypothetical protein BJF84_00130 [Rhodococcus sp. CUA-806]|nr:hypothetical protein BJF84_00130 [Rhodococcus sp. CUA-806]
MDRAKWDAYLKPGDRQAAITLSESLPDTSYDEIVQKANRETLDEDKPINNQHRLVLNYLRHNHTGYDYNQTHKQYRIALLAAVLAYPELEGEALRQLARKPWFNNFSRKVARPA